jgi:large subunit ribosomal protein L9
MKVILLQNIKSLGLKDEVKTVSDGYASNFLLPQKLAVPATPDLVRQTAERREKMIKEKQSSEKDLDKLIAKISNKKITIVKEASEKGKLFAAVSVAEVFTAIKNDLGATLDVKHLKIGEHLKEIGVHEVPLQINNKKINLTVEIKAKAETASTKKSK